MSFSATVPVETLQDAIEPVSALVDECKIRLNDDGLSIRAVDPANVGMVDMSLAKSAFESDRKSTRLNSSHQSTSR